ncbi:integrase core domain-containing protein [Methylobacterium brachiatum]|nr:integrase core domain-containing protein [Methylobacterium brachiatum]MCB4805519.1 integrase core domain-containing protein [Methylobacterium brachiatum]
MIAIHTQARNIPAVRAEIARSHDSSGVLAKRYGVSTGFRLDALTFVVSHFPSHLNRDASYRILRVESLNRLPPAEQARKPHGTFQDYQVGFINVNVKHLLKLRDRDGTTCQRDRYVAIDRAFRYVHLAVKDDETIVFASAFLADALGALPFRVTHRCSCFTADAFEAACEQHGVQHRMTRPYTPKTNGMVKRSNGCVQREVLGITLYSHSHLEIVLRGFNAV